MFVLPGDVNDAEDFKGGLSDDMGYGLTDYTIYVLYSERKKTHTFLHYELPPEFVDLCEADGVTPETVLRGFIADLAGIMNWAANPRADGYSSNGSDERSMAMDYYQRVGYPYWKRDKLSPLRGGSRRPVRCAQQLKKKRRLPIPRARSKMRLWKKILQSMEVRLRFSTASS